MASPLHSAQTSPQLKHHQRFASQSLGPLDRGSILLKYDLDHFSVTPEGNLYNGHGFTEGEDLFKDKVLKPCSLPRRLPCHATFSFP